jgi:hypothetical protein
MPRGARLSLERDFEILMPGLVPGISFSALAMGRPQ